MGARSLGHRAHRAVLQRSNVIVMRSLSASELLEAWERGLNQSPIQRALELLWAVYPQATIASLASLAIGRRDAELLALREQLFGSEMAGVAVCPQCGGRLDLTLSAREMLLARTEPEAEESLCMDGYELRFRLPNSEDLTAALQYQNAQQAERLMLSRCLVSILRDGAAVECDELPQVIVEAVSGRMTEVDPLADVQVAVACPSCHHRWRGAFDIVSFLWSEIDSLAARLLRDVHTLATAYGWSETDILALSPARRQFYLASVSA
jgi:hypothetical protein